MKGFDIEIKNNLLEPKHVEGMGSAVWLYMLLVDKLTSVDEKGIGKVLGGKPLKYEDDIKKELGISEDTYGRWIKKLMEYPYIITTRTPYGISFKVLKAHKKFKKRTRESAVSHSADVRNLSRENAESNKTDTVRDNISKTSPRGGVTGEMIWMFREVNPSYEILYNRRPQHNAIRRMIEKHGEEKLKAIITFLPRNNATPYAPKITTPMQLEEKMGQLIAHWQQEKQKSKPTKIGVI
jgi:hypothetical protein